MVIFGFVKYRQLIIKQFGEFGKTKGEFYLDPIILILSPACILSAFLRKSWCHKGDFFSEMVRFSFPRAGLTHPEAWQSTNQLSSLPSRSGMLVKHISYNYIHRARAQETGSHLKSKDQYS